MWNPYIVLCSSTSVSSVWKPAGHQHNPIRIRFHMDACIIYIDPYITDLDPAADPTGSISLIGYTYEESKI